MTAKRGFSQLPHGFHERIAELSGAQLKVWLAHRCREGKKGKSYPSLDRLAQDTGLGKDAVKGARKWLRENNWLVSSGQTHTTSGRFSIPIEHTVIPDVGSGKTPPRLSEVAEVKHRSGKIPPRCSGKTPPRCSGKTPPRTVVVKHHPEVDPKSFEVDPREVNPGGVEAATPAPPLFSKGGTGEPSRPKIDLSVADQVTKNIIVYAKGVNKAASFSGKSNLALKEAVCAIIAADGYASVEDFTRDLYEIVQEKIRNCDDFNLKNFGSSLAVELAASIEVKQRSRLRQEQAKAESESARMEFENDRRHAEGKKQEEEQWYRDFELVRNGSTEELDAWRESRHIVYDSEETWALFWTVYAERKAEELATTTGKEATA